MNLPARPRARLSLVLAAAFLLAPLGPRPAAAQATPPAVSAQPRADAIDVFLDCPPFECDQDFMHTEITWVNWMRDRADADVHVLVTTQNTGGGGTEYTLAFLGQRRFAGIGDTLRYVSNATSTPDERRHGLARTIQLGLVRFAARTPQAAQLGVTFTAPPAAAGGAGGGTPGAPAMTTHDPWNYWVFSLSLNGNEQKEQSFGQQYFSGNLNASRITQDWKVQLPAREFYAQSDYTFDGEKTTSIRRSYSFDPLVVKSLGPRWSAGFQGSLGSSTFENKRFSYRLTPAVEYDIFPYSESTRRMLTLRYGVGVEGFRYVEETIYFRTAESRPVHTATLSLSQNQPWGTINVSLNGSQYLDNARQNSASVGGSTNVRLFRGFSFNVGGNYTAIHNQLFLPRRGATQEEVLTQQRQLATDYSYFVFFGLRYTFGSIFNNVVNPRFGGGGDFFFMM